MSWHRGMDSPWRSSRVRAGEQADSPQRRRILITVAVVAGLAFSVLIARLWYMQILLGEHFRLLSENNRIRLVDMPPSRGLIFDRKGRLLADNRPTFTLAVVPEDVPEWKLLARRLHSLVGLEESELKKALAAARGQPPFKPVRVKSHLDREQLAVLETFRYELPGVRVLVEYRRAYHAARETAHLIGYLGEINRRELARAPRSLYRMGDYVGRSGLEASRERVLHGRRGARQVEVDVHGRELAVLKQVNPEPGNSLVLTIDLDLQRAAAKALAGEAGAVVALDPNNGQVLCLYSSPSYDQNSFITGMTSAEWKAMAGDEKHPLKNRAISGLYPPGSTYKIITAAAGLQEGVITPHTTFFCSGEIPFGRRRYRCWAYKKGGHGLVDLHRAIRESCDVYFYKVGLRLGVDRLAKYARAFGLGRKTGIPLAHESPGLVPDSKWKKRRFGEPWQDGETLSVAIGQSFNLVTPLQLARMVAVVANRGKLVTPTLVKAVIPPNGKPIPVMPGVISRVPVKPEYLEIINQGLIGVVNEPGGTARNVRLPGITVAGKTGTAQVVSLKIEKSYGKGKQVPWKYRPHGLFVAYAPAENPKIALAVVVEHGMHGGSGAGPVAKAVLEAFFHLNEPGRTPKEPKPPAPRPVATPAAAPAAPAAPARRNGGAT